MIDDATTDAKQFSQITFSGGDPVPGPGAAFICLSITATAQVIFSRGAKKGSTKRTIWQGRCTYETPAWDLPTTVAIAVERNSLRLDGHAEDIESSPARKARNEKREHFQGILPNHSKKLWDWLLERDQLKYWTSCHLRCTNRQRGYENPQTGTNGLRKDGGPRDGIGTGGFLECRNCFDGWIQMLPELCL